MLNIIIAITVIHAITLNNLEFTYSPIIFLSFIIRSINMSIKGKRIPFAICEKTSIVSTGYPGIKAITTPNIMHPRYVA